MKPSLKCLAAAAAFFSASLVSANHDIPDGVELTVSIQPGPGPTEVRLDWTGGQPLFQVYRSTSPQNVVSPANLLGQTPDTTWIDPAVGDILFYTIASPCAYPQAEVCDGVDNNCSGATDEGAGCFPIGDACAAAADCVGNVDCVDGFCCESACAADCLSCGLAGLEGTCSPEPAGTPDGACHGHFCDGAGICETTCATDLECVATHLCESDMTCRSRCSSDADCAGGYACRPDQHCQPSCASDLACASGYTCDVTRGQCLNANLLGARISTGGLLLETDIPIQDVPHDQRRPAIAFDGTNFLIAWSDTRNVAAGEAFVARYDPDGVATQPGPVQLPAGAGGQDAPAVAWGGSNYLVVWQEDGGGVRDIRGTRVSASGVILDNPTIAISTGPADESDPAIAFDGTNFLVVWRDTRNVPTGEAFVRRFGPDGVAVQPGPISVPAGAGGQEAPAVAWNGSNYLVVWAEGSLGQRDIRGVRVSLDGTLVDVSSIGISSAAGDQFEPTVASDGTNFIVAWTDTRSGNADVYGARVSDAGLVLDPSGVGLLVDPSFDARANLVFADWSATDWALVSMGNDDPTGGLNGDSSIGVLRLDTLGGPIATLPPFPVASGPHERRNPVVASKPDGWLVAWEDWRSQPGPIQVGNACALNADCASGFCVGGVCCNNACNLQNADASCSTGTCALLFCSPGFDDCNAYWLDGCENDLLTDISHCSACGVACSTNHIGTPSCSSGTCDGGCDAGWDDCNADKQSDGCETDLLTDVSHCSACDIACSTNHIGTPSCSSGMCDGVCDAGWGDCNADKLSDGCEADLTSVADCGSCGNSCADADACTNDVCNFPGTCAHVDLSACSESACAGGPCTFADTDGDGLNDTWETNGYIDVNCNGSNEPGIDTPLPASDPARPNIYVKYDYMVKAGSGAPCVTPTDCPDPGEQCVANLCAGHSHAPSPAALDLVRQAFLLQDVILTFDPVSTEIPERAVVTFGAVDEVCNGLDAVNFYDLKTASFPPPLRYGYHYMVFGHHNTCPDPAHCLACPTSPETGTQPVAGMSGIAEVFGNDCIVSLGGAYLYSAPPVLERMVAGTFMHELGHNLDLRHGGGDDLDKKPNYISVMNSSYQFGIPVSATPGPYPTTEVDPSTDHRIDYSSRVLDALQECGGLDEMVGVSGDAGSLDVVIFYVNPGPVQLFAPSNGTPVDWNFNGFPFEAGVFADINADGQCSVLEGSDDWPALDYAFQCSVHFID